MMLPQLVSFWDGPVTWLERLCVASMLGHGHSIAIYTYDPKTLEKCGLGADIRDAREIIPDNDFDQRFRAHGRFAIFSDIFRLKLLKKVQSVWVDLDCLLLKPLDLDTDYIFGWASHKKINNAVLGLPSDSLVLNDYIDTISADPMQVPWSSFRRQVLRKYEIFKGHTRPDPKSHINLGPRSLTYFVKKHKLVSHAQPTEVFYPFLVQDTRLLVKPIDVALENIKQNTIIVHVWRTTFKNLGFLQIIPSKDTYIGNFCHDYDIAQQGVS